MKNLFTQTNETTRNAIALLLGFEDGVQTGFRNRLREIPALPEGWTIGDATDAYLRHMIGYFSGMPSQSQD